MRQFILGKNVAYPTDADITAWEDGAVGFTVNQNGVLTVSTNGSGIKDKANIVVGRPNSKGGPIVIPFYKNNFSFVKGEYQAGSTFSATVTIPAITSIGDYTLIVAKKGVQFNYRNKWTAETHVHDVSKVDASKVAAKLVEAINNNSESSGVTAKVGGDNNDQVIVTAIESGVDYTLVGAEQLFGIEVTDVTAGSPAYGDAKYVQDLAEKAAADAGFEYTYRDAYTYLYPDYPLNPLKADDAADTGFTIFTIKFAEPRETKTFDTAVNQIVQIAYPTGAAAIATMETVLNGIAGITAAAPTTPDNGSESGN